MNRGFLLRKENKFREALADYRALAKYCGLAYGGMVWVMVVMCADWSLEARPE